MMTWSTTDIPRLPIDHDGTPVRVHDTASGDLVPVGGQDGTARLYVCGITPYDATHLGHAATYVTFDVLQRAWRDAGLAVTYVQNVTDVDEPLLERAERDGLDWRELASREISLFFEDMEALRVLPPDHYIGAVEGIPDDVSAVERLLEDGTAYLLPVPEGEQVAEGASGQDVYLDLSTQPSFGAVSGWTREQMMEVFADRGGDPGRAGKRDPLDPLLWRSGREGEPHWDGGSLGQGRPGWHIECSTIAQRYLGPGFDVQGGGTDLVFPHHEMSAVQAAALCGDDCFARAYVHQAMVGLDGEKMSKSKGNLVLVSKLRAAGVDPMVIRLALLSQHYRSEWQWTDQILREADDRLELWRRASDMAANESVTDLGRDTVRRLRERLADDLDTPGALDAVDDWATTVAAGEPASGLVPQAVDALLGVQL
ncbi:L-cysteine:1D-myo-inosityl 2-amino-2-deoxy-alpha-D-glucopyranoside ligase MshC [Serinicoccus hydrothermalis]|uniref:L-cysteine:1D-myo-inositol 2-amino-2-deoxy-alpha-D-glucopyranoside ligase n=1 Tax=Serinicoccus hydrothermalis TaxID=1758689 RepID=A0A1B1N8F9_9MICO|nr:cysteine--1-D-myo-inosityl 2-amino-2-deoxy-alpha-D-glucopyranoside ligase [Serinicoccus hydrothermalis]ANS77720.1 L-cysteine:1D-myo-inosityl 2-amino-2-deoxy-alpha-D-glucopyranoside ligase MshC [Serinicoccus hydrothermalis]